METIIEKFNTEKRAYILVRRNNGYFIKYNNTEESQLCRNPEVQEQIAKTVARWRAEEIEEKEADDEAWKSIIH